jgi:Tetracyclin repressor-like, C-terminal domain
VGATRLSHTQPNSSAGRRDRTDAEYLEMEAMLMGFVDDVRSQLTASEPLPRLRQLASAHVRWRLHNPEIAEVFDIAFGLRKRVMSLPEEHRARIRAIKRMYIDELRGILNAGARSGTFDFVTLCGSAHTWYDPEGDLSIEEVAAMYADFAAGMVRAPMRVE